MLMTFDIPRILACHTGSLGTPLHELPPKVLHRAVWYLLFIGRSGRTCRQGIGPIVQVRSSFGYGH